MDIELFLIAKMFEPYTWIILALIVLVIDIFLGFVLLPFGISALGIAFLVFSDKNSLFGDFHFFQTWENIISYYAILTIVTMVIIKFVFRKSSNVNSDINHY